MNKIKVLLIVIVLLFVGMQFFQISKTNPITNAEEDFLKITAATPDIQTMLKNACYDCHSNQTVYPWYTYVNPIGFFVANHIREGREELNFSIWASYDEKKQSHKIEESIKEIEKNKMPLKSYIFAHADAKLSEADKTKLIDWLNTLID